MIKKHKIGKRRCFSVQLLQEKVIKINFIKEALNIKMQITQKRGWFFSAATDGFFSPEQNQGNT